ncbi:hypothetical protein ABR738_01170 [Streptomyces sp. Edi4]|uniref:hypothetical protein n=1 Tax=Streptomyces sp. Edi4 TaxID=3162527 RepID=UPI003305AB3E
MADGLYDRYMKASRVNAEHQRGCNVCTAETRCTAGTQIFKSFARLQDAYNNRLRQQNQR